MELEIHVIHENLGDGRRRFRGEVVLDPGGENDKTLYVGPMVCDCHAAALDAIAWRQEYMNIRDIRDTLSSIGYTVH